MATPSVKKTAPSGTEINGGLAPKTKPPDLAAVGKHVDDIKVSLGYRLIDLFSGQLYSNPAKAIEELIVNSFDAYAHQCQVVIPDNLEDPDATVLVWDNGESMDIDGLQELWLIAESHKRDPAREKAAAKKGRLPIGRFGIGKLASYVIGRRISHICKHDGIYLIVTMDYSDLIPDETKIAEVISKNPQIKETKLSVREITESQVREVLDFCVSGNLAGGVKLPLFGKESPKSWTLVVVDHLKPKVREIHRGRLNWIISTALPLVPDFVVDLNGKTVEPSKLKQKVLKRWQIGKGDKIAERLGYDSGTDDKADHPFDYWVNVPGIGHINGELVLYEETLTGGKAEDNGRSHGFFIKVRQRLVNHNDEVFGSYPLSHQTLNRLNAVIHADGLDDTLVASRESVSTEQQEALLKYLQAKFYEARDYYDDWLLKQSKEETVAERVKSVPPPLVSFPLRHAIETTSEPSGPTLRSIAKPIPGSKIEKTIKGFETAFLDPDSPIAIFDPSTGIVTLNAAHPFCANYSDSTNLHVIATAEIMTEAYMVELGIPQQSIETIMKRRDDLLRELVRSSPEGVDMVAQRIKDAVHDEQELEHACHSAFRTLGFTVTPMGAGPNKPDGIASAPLGMRSSTQDSDSKSRSYVVIYDAKSTGNDKVKSSHLDLAGIKNHRNKFGERFPEDSRYSIIIAPGYEGEEDEKSKANSEARDQKVTLMRASDLARLLEASGRLPLSLEKLRLLFDTCRTPKESQKWIDDFTATESTHGLDRLLLDAIWKVQNEEEKDPPQIAAIRERTPELKKKYSSQDLVEILKSFARLVPTLVIVYNNQIVYLDQPPDTVVQHIRKRLAEMKSGPKSKN